METMPSNRSKRGPEELDRRAFLRGGVVLAAAMTGYTLVESAAAEPLAEDSWSKVPGSLVPAGICTVRRTRSTWGRPSSRRGSGLDSA